MDDPVNIDNLTLGELIDHMFRTRESKRAFEEEVKAINGEIEKTSQLILDKMNELGVSTIRSQLASASITQQVLPQIDDFDAVLEWINNDFEGRKHIMQRRVASAAWRELESMEGAIPGIKGFTKRGIGLRKLQS